MEDMCHQLPDFCRLLLRLREIFVFWKDGTVLEVQWDENFSKC